MNIQLKSQQERFIRSQIESGEYQSVDDVIAEAFKLLEARVNKSELVEYARQSALDVRSGKLKPQSVAEIMSQLDESMDEELE